MGEAQTSAGGDRARSGRRSLVGRDREQAALLAALRPGWLVFVSGAAGIGKTALMRTIAVESPREAPIVYVPDGRTRASACTGLAAALRALAPRSGDGAPRIRRLGRTARSAMIAARRTENERGVVFDHVDFPGPVLDGLVDLWRERTAVVLVARSEATLGKLHRHLYDCTAIRLEPLDSASARRLIESAAGGLGLSLTGCEIDELLRLGAGLPRLICRALHLRSRPDGRQAPIAQLVRRARLDAIAGERDAIIRERRRLASRTARR